MRRDRRGNGGNPLWNQYPKMAGNPSLICQIFFESDVGPRDQKSKPKTCRSANPYRSHATSVPNQPFTRVVTMEVDTGTVNLVSFCVLVVGLCQLAAGIRGVLPVFFLFFGRSCRFSTLLRAAALWNCLWAHGFHLYGSV